MALLSMATANEAHEVGQTTINNIYKPQGHLWSPHVLQPLPHAAVCMSNFNSHRKMWKYQTSDQKDKDLVKWVEDCNAQLTFKAKNRGTLNQQPEEVKTS